ncbi:unnamed protein product, partial [Vitis vinifera]
MMEGRCHLHKDILCFFL